MPDKIPEASHILLVNPTKYLGNLLIAGGLIQDFGQFCLENGKHLTVVLDASYQSLVGNSLSGAEIIYYPRRKIYAGNPVQKCWAYMACVRQVREKNYDLAFVLEEDSVAHRLVRFSRSRFKLGCAEHRHKKGFDWVLPVNYHNRTFEKQHRWYCYQEVFRALGFDQKIPSYMSLYVDSAEHDFLYNLGIQQDVPFVIIHAGASRDYKKWPAQYFAELCALLQQQLIQPVLVGAGAPDQCINQDIIKELSKQSCSVPCVDVCNKLTLHQLAGVMKAALAIIGNDSGPFHLASALGLPGLTIYGPTEPELWGPLGRQSRVLQGNRVCVKACREPECIKDHACLRSLSPQAVFRELLSLLDSGMQWDTPLQAMK